MGVRRRQIQTIMKPNWEIMGKYEGNAYAASKRPAQMHIRVEQWSSQAN